MMIVINRSVHDVSVNTSVVRSWLRAIERHHDDDVEFLDFKLLVSEIIYTHDLALIRLTD